MEYRAIKFHKWTIEDFASYDMKRGQFLRSPTFSAGTGDGSELKWYLKLYPNGHGLEDSSHIAVLVHLKKRTNLQLIVQYEFSILNAKLEKTNKEKYQLAGEGSGFLKFIARDVLLGNADSLLPGGKLIIFCELSVFAKIANSDQSQVMEPECALVGDLHKMCLNEKFSDVTLEVRGLVLPAHKIILASQSDVFTNIFEREMEDNRLNRIIITDVEPQVLQEMLRYIYTGTVPNLDKMAAALFSIADKYNIEKLKVKCGKKITEQLSVKSAVDTLLLADLHNAEQLKKQAMDFITAHSSAVVATSALQKLTTRPGLLVEAYRALATYANTTHSVTKK